MKALQWLADNDGDDDANDLLDIWGLVLSIITY